MLRILFIFFPSLFLTLFSNGSFVGATAATATTSQAAVLAVYPVTLDNKELQIPIYMGKPIKDAVYEFVTTYGVNMDSIPMLETDIKRALNDQLQDKSLLHRDDRILTVGANFGLPDGTSIPIQFELDGTEELQVLEFCKSQNLDFRCASNLLKAISQRNRNSKKLYELGIDFDERNVPTLVIPVELDGRKEAIIVYEADSVDTAVHTFMEKHELPPEIEESLMGAAIDHLLGLNETYFDTNHVLKNLPDNNPKGGVYHETYSHPFRRLVDPKEKENPEALNKVVESFKGNNNNKKNHNKNTSNNVQNKSSTATRIDNELLKVEKKDLDLEEEEKRKAAIEEILNEESLSQTNAYEKDSSFSTEQIHEYLIDLYVNEESKPLIVRENDDFVQVARKWCIEAGSQSEEHVQIVLEAIETSVREQRLKRDMEASQTAFYTPIIVEEEDKNVPLFEFQVVQGNPDYSNLIVINGYTPLQLAEQWCKENNVPPKDYEVIALLITEKLQIFHEKYAQIKTKKKKTDDKDYMEQELKKEIIYDDTNENDSSTFINTTTTQIEEETEVTAPNASLKKGFSLTHVLLDKIEEISGGNTTAASGFVVAFSVIFMLSVSAFFGTKQSKK